jgi:hypothetical protein
MLNSSWDYFRPDPRTRPMEIDIRNQNGKIPAANNIVHLFRKGALNRFVNHRRCNKPAMTKETIF